MSEISPSPPKGMRPMHAQAFEPDRAQFPLYIQPKYDGIRCLTIDGFPWSRTFKLIPNQAIQKVWDLHKDWLNMLDGELIVGSPTDPDVYRKTMSGVMSQGGNPDWHYYVFDFIDITKPFMNRWYTFADRVNRLYDVKGPSDFINRIHIVPTFGVESHEDIAVREAKFLIQGYEGAMLRTPHGKYKYGRSTAKGGELNKLKRYTDEEAQIVGFVELMRNDNEAVDDNFGLQKRSAHKANKIPMDTLGSLEVINARGEKFNVGSGFDVVTRKEIWDNRHSYIGAHITYRYVKIGGYDVPRFPIFKGFRHKDDIGDPK